MKLHHDTLASAAVFYHRFYQIHSFYKFRSRYVTATCCLFLAGKVEETPKKWTDLIKGARTILQVFDFWVLPYNNAYIKPQQFAQFGTLEEAKDELMAMERVLLQTIKFDFNVEHAHKYIIQVNRQKYCTKYILKCLVLRRTTRRFTKVNWRGKSKRNGATELEFCQWFVLY